MFIVAPIRTEKAVAKMEFDNTMTFEVVEKATKKDVKVEVESMFGVKVDSVRMKNTPKGKKHAVVTLAKGSKTDDIAAKLKLI